MSKIFTIEEDSLQERFHNSRAKIQYYGGGFANGKTANSVMKALTLAKNYPGSNGLIARATYPKLNDTIRKEFIKWCPKSWIKSFPISQNASNTCTLKNGTMISFRYIQQQNKTGETSTSNLLSATYDWIVVDQMEDPEISYKDFLDLMGRLRGNTPYVGDDPTMPETGPRWFIITSNPTRNWLYRKIIKPYHIYKQSGQITEDLLLETDEEGNTILDKEGNPKLLIEVFEGSTYENKNNLAPDFIRSLESVYSGQMRDRFLLGNWGAYEGLVYPQYDENIHKIPHNKMVEYINILATKGYKLSVIEGYDYGMAVPSCYLFCFIDHIGAIHAIDGFYLPEMQPEATINLVKQIRLENTGLDLDTTIWSDPSIFKRSAKDKNIVGKSLADILFDEGNGIRCIRANNGILNGITKVQQYLTIHPQIINPYTGQLGAPLFYHSDKLEFITNEITDYFWKKDSTTQEAIDAPNDKNDHALDVIKYILSYQPKASELIKSYTNVAHIVNKWIEVQHSTNRNTRHG